MKVLSLKQNQRSNLLQPLALIYTNESMMTQLGTGVLSGLQMLIPKRRSFLTLFPPFLLGAAAFGVMKSDRTYRLPKNFPPPKFWFGQTVRFEWICDDTKDSLCGQLKWQQGLVVGMSFNDPEIYEKGWAYTVDWTSSYNGIVDSSSILGESDLTL
ncbi:hypothetical protein [Argonema antarcticum]|uniref:hypothetical protein n=1 Tax=Argonema antarcticum TaxID=2942763 RepID=UPI0020134E45|nr:hypothetical protein [Argonema antarcticum]MCL1474408.1 hypothetical protein [Argonema antarcticum A004/B2]